MVLCIRVISFTANAQLPNFTKVDTGAITIIPDGHVSSACFDMDNDGDLDLLVSNVGVYISRPFSIYKNERNGYIVKILAGLSHSKNLNSFGDIDNDGDADLFTSSQNPQVFNSAFTITSVSRLPVSPLETRDKAGTYFHGILATCRPGFIIVC